MTHRNNLGAHTIAILTTLEERGTCTARQVTDATGLEYDTARQYLRPFRDPGDDAQDETMGWLPVPSLEVTAC